MFIKVRDLYDNEWIINVNHIICMTYEGSATTIALDNKLTIWVPNTLDEILEVLKEADPLRAKILDQMEDIDKMLDNMEKNDPWEDLMRRLSDENKN